MKKNKFNKFLPLLIIIFTLASCSGRSNSPTVDKYMNLIKDYSGVINLYYKNPSVENYSKVKNIWSATPDEMMENKDDVGHTAKIFYVFSRLAEDKYGYGKIKLESNWTSTLLCSAFFDEIKKNDLLELYLNPKIISVDTLDYNWAAYSATGDAKYINYIKSQFNNIDSIVSGAAKWSFNSMAEQDKNIIK